MHTTPRFHALPALTRRTATLLAALLITGAQAQPVKLSETNPEASPNWQKVKATLFKGRNIAPAPAGLLSLEAPVRAADAAVVPVAMRTQMPAGDSRQVKRLYLVIDSNPTVVAGVFDFSPGNGNPEIETRVRVDEYTHVRAIAELSDGTLLMSTRFVKASGGCSAPAGKDPAEALANLGKMRLRVDGDLRPGQPMLAQLMINHPNHSGMAMDQVTRQFTPAHFVRQVNVSYGGKPVMSAEIDFSISENPNLRFRFVPRGPGELKVEAIDSQDLRFESALALTPGAS
jgi:sulfur-oxidizing protein SoxY